MDDRELVQRLLAKDEIAQQYFFNTYWKKVYKACVYVLGYKDPEAEDVAQEALLVALRKLPEFEFRSSLHHWLFRICTFLCYERIRLRKKRLAHLQENIDDLPYSAHADHDRRKEEDAETKRMIEVVAQQRELMGDPCRNLLRLRDEESQSYAAIAETLKVPIGTVMSRLARCKETLKKLVLNVLKGTDKEPEVEVGI